MSAKLPFYKYSGNGNDFIILDQPYLTIPEGLVRRLCDRHFGVGADGVLQLTQEPGFDGGMRIFNADGGEAEMCGNGIRCLVTYLDDKGQQAKDHYTIKTMNGAYDVVKIDGAFAIEMSELRDQNLYDLSIFRDFKKTFFINTGVPHLVFLVEDAKSLDIKSVAPTYRNHPVFPRGTNVSFVEILEGKQTAYVRTFERGVEDETHSCGTGLTASGLALNDWEGWEGKIILKTLGGTQYVSVADKIHYSGEVTYCFSGEVPL